MLAIPLLAEPAVAERDLRMRNHAGALGRFYLDALLGLVTIRTHGAAPALVREHQDRLHEWVRAARAALRAALGAEALQALVGFGLAAWLLVDFFGRTGGHDAGAGLLHVLKAVTTAPACSRSTGHCRCRCSGTSWRSSSSRCPGSAA